MIRGKIAKRPKEARKGLSPNLGKNIKSNLPTKESNKNIKLTLPIPPNPPWNEINNTSSTPLSNAGAHTAHTLTQKQNKRQTKTEHQKQAKLQKSKSVTYLHYWDENMLSFSCFLNVLTLRDNLISLGKEFQNLNTK